MLPSGTVTLLFTDIENSSALWDRAPDAMRTALARHDRIIVDAISGHHGFVVKNKGDGFFAVFGSAIDAIGAALDAQHGITSEAWSDDTGTIRVRMALHTGTIDHHDGDYFGPPVNRVARIEASAHGGQTLLSSSTAELVRAHLPHDVTMKDLGVHRLRGLARPEHIYQLTASALPGVFPPLRTLDTSQTNLPLASTSFVGRTEELSEIAGLLANPDCRLLTLLGPGGIGKTRLAIETAKQLRSVYPNGAHFVPLAPIREPDHIIPTVAEALRLTIDTNSSDLTPKDQLLDFLADQSALMVLDNFEQVVEGAGLVAEVLGQAPNLRVLVTSRRKLGLQGEWTYEVPPLPYPTNGEEPATYPAVRLFLDRARQADTTFEPSRPDWDNIRRVCRLVDGLPLAIELAAAWTSLLSCSEIAHEIEANLDFLSTTMQDVPERHRSARAVFNWSWNLLPSHPKDAYRELSVFRGGFDRQAASTVAGATIADLAELTNRSLIHRDDTGRFSLHQMLQQFAATRLHEDPDVEIEVRNRHARFFAALADAHSGDLNGPKVLDALATIRADIDNIRSAVEWSMVRLPESETVTLLRTLSRFYGVHNPHEGQREFARLAAAFTAGRTFAEAVLHPAYVTALSHEMLIASFSGHSDVSEEQAEQVLDATRSLGLDLEEAICLYGFGVRQAFREDWDAARLTLQRVVALARTLGDTTVLGGGLLWLGWVDLEDGDPVAAENEFSESLAVFRESDDVWGTAYALSKMGLIADANHDYLTALQRHLEGFETFRRLDDAAGQGYTLSRASMSAYALGGYEAAMRYGLEGLEHFEKVGHRWGVAASLGRVGYAALGVGDVADARHRFTEALRKATDAGFTNLVLFAIIGLGGVLAAEGSTERAAELLMFGLGHPATPAIYRDIGQPLLDNALASLPDDRRAAAKRRAADLDLDDVVRRLLT